MARRANSEIYQVDLIAALFGGFMISWLVSAQETEFQVYSKPLKFATIEMRVVGSHSGVGETIWINALPFSAVADTGCVGAELAEDLIGGIRRYSSCSSEPAEILNTSVTSAAADIGYWNNVVDACKASSSGGSFPKTQTFYSNWALDAVLPNFVSPLGTVHRKFEPSEILASPEKPIFLWSRTFGNCGVSRDKHVASQVFLVSQFDHENENSVPLPISSGNAALLLTGMLSGASASSTSERRFLFSDVFELVNLSNEILESTSHKMSNLRVQALLCVFSEGTETCYGGEQPLTHTGAPALTLDKGIELW